MAHPVSPLAPDHFPEMPVIDGVRLATGAVGIRYKGRTDLLLVDLAPGSTLAGCYTRSLSSSAPVDWCREAERAGGGRARAIVVNSGNANAFTGRLGREAVDLTVAAVAKTLDVAHAAEVFVASTGVIGEPLAADKIVAGLPGVAASLKPEGWAEAARAIMTTDTFPKGATASAKIDGVTVHLNGFAKGSGMIAPDMATMLGFLFTEAALPAEVLGQLLRPAADRSFNSITVDSDTSTSDTLLLAATGRAKHAPVTSADDPRLDDFRRALEAVCRDLALQIVRDGEGAEKLITIDITGAESPAAARRIGLSIANSPLVKTAIAGEDANWGRIVAAVGKAGERADRDKLQVVIGGVVVARDGARVPDFDEAPVAAHIKTREIHIAVDVGVGQGAATVWTCDLTHRYLDINAGYRS